MSTRSIYEMAEAIAPGWERWRARIEDIVSPVRVWMLAELAPRPGDTVLELAAGAGDTGFETVAVVGERGRLISTDFSPAMLDVARRRGAELGLRNVDCRLMDAERIELDADAVDGVLCRFGYMLMPDPAAALAEMRRVVRPDGVVAAYVWDYTEGMQLMRRFWDAAAELDPGVRDLDEGLRFPLCRPEPLGELFTEAGLADVAVEEIVVPTVFADFADYWTPFLGGTGPAPAYAAHLPEPDRAALRESLRSSLPTEPDGSIHLTARAWAVRGRRSSHAAS